MKTLKSALAKLTWLDAILWGQMVVTVTIGIVVNSPKVLWGLYTALTSLSAMVLIFNAVKF